MPYMFGLATGYKGMAMPGKCIAMPLQPFPMTSNVWPCLTIMWEWVVKGIGCKGMGTPYM